MMYEYIRSCCLDSHRFKSFFANGNSISVVVNVVVPETATSALLSRCKGWAADVSMTPVDARFNMLLSVICPR